MPAGIQFNQDVPFTGSHPAAVLPLLLGRRIRAWLAPSGLVIGSMAPDLPYYLPGHVPVGATHSLAGIFGVDLVMGLAAVLLWHGLLGPAALAVAPAALRARVQPDVPIPVRLRFTSSRLAALVVALLIGAATHVLWDEFTHPDRFGTRHVGWLGAEHAGLAGYRWAQYGSGLVGGVVLLVAAALWWRSSPPDRPRPGVEVRHAALAWTAVVVAALVGGLVGATHSWDDGIRRVLFSGATWGGGSALGAALLVAVLVVGDRRAELV